MEKTIFEELANLELQKKQIELQIEETRSKVVEEMEKTKADKVETNYGKFFFTIRKIWKYSESVKNASDNLKNLQTKEQENGTATFEEKKSLTFRAEK